MHMYTYMFREYIQCVRKWNRTCGLKHIMLCSTMHACSGFKLLSSYVSACIRSAAGIHLLNPSPFKKSYKGVFILVGWANWKGDVSNIFQWSQYP